MSSNYKRLVFLFVLISLAIGFIFYNSFQNSEESNNASDVIEKVVERIVYKIVGENDIDINYLVRKAAHLTEFCVLGLVVMSVVFTAGLKYLGYGLFYVLAVAVTDEFIQSFSDRTSSVKDILIDFTGAMIGFVICTVIFLTVRRIRKTVFEKHMERGKHFKK